MINTKLLKSFETAVLNDIPGTNYAYASFGNVDLLIKAKLDIACIEDKVLIFDKDIKYFNASALCKAFGLNSTTKDVHGYTRLKQFKELAAAVQEDLQKEYDELPADNPMKLAYEKSKAFNKTYRTISPTFIDRNTKTTPVCAGTYIHPVLIINVLIWCNRYISFELNTLVTTILLRQGVNQEMKVDRITNKQQKKLEADAHDRNEFMKDYNKEDDSRFIRDAIERQYNNSLFFESMRNEVKRKTKRKVKPISLNELCTKKILIIRYYDNDEFVYDPPIPGEDDDEFYEPVSKVQLKIIKSADAEKAIKSNMKEITNKREATRSFERTAEVISLRLCPEIPYNDENINRSIVVLYQDDVMIEYMEDCDCIKCYDYCKFKKCLCNFCAGYLYDY